MYKTSIRATKNNTITNESNPLIGVKTTVPEDCLELDPDILARACATPSAFVLAATRVPEGAE